MGKKSETISWSIPNWWTFFVFMASIIIINLETENPVRQFFSDQGNHGFLGSCFAGFVYLTTQLYAKQIEAFSPKDSLSAKRANEQIMSLSTAINAIGAGVAVAVAIKQLPEPNPDYEMVLIAIGIGAWIHTGARGLLGLLKDENFDNKNIPECDADKVLDVE